MGKTKKVKLAGRFGPRYGSTIRSAFREIETKRRAIHRCPQCETRGTVRRTSAGIWYCTKCKSSFAGGAYVPKTEAATGTPRKPSQ